MEKSLTQPNIFEPNAVKIRPESAGCCNNSDSRLLESKESQIIGDLSQRFVNLWFSSPISQIVEYR